jgi:dTMP kinase
VRAIKGAGIEVLATHEPGDAPGADEIRKLLLNGPPERWDAVSEALLMVAARRCHVTATIRPALAAGQWVVCDRFADSTRVYQGTLGEVDRRLIKGLERVSIGELAPDLTLILDVPVEVGLERIALRRGDAKPDRFEAESVEYHEKLRQAFRALAADEPQRCVVIDASVAKEEVAKQVWNVVNAKLDPATAPLTSENLVS